MSRPGFEHLSSRMRGERLIKCATAGDSFGVVLSFTSFRAIFDEWKEREMDKYKDLNMWFSQINEKISLNI